MLFITFAVIKQIQEDVTKHRMLIFKDQGVISGDRHVEISRWFGELESTFYKHAKSPHPDVFRVSNDKNEGCTGKFVYKYSRNLIIQTGWDQIMAGLNKTNFKMSIKQILDC